MTIPTHDISGDYIPAVNMQRLMDIGVPTSAIIIGNVGGETGVELVGAPGADPGVVLRGWAGVWTAAGVLVGGSVM